MDKRLTYILLIITLITGPAFSQSVADQAQLANEYYVEGEFEKANDLFEKLARNKSTIPLIHSNYLSYLFQQQDFKTADKYLRQVLKLFPGNFTYIADRIYYYDVIGNENDKQDYIRTVLSKHGSNQYQLTLLAQNLSNRDLMEDARDFYLYAREISNSLSAFALDLANVYRMLGDKESMTKEYLRYASMHQRNTRYVKNIFQQLLSDPEDLEYLESTLIDYIQKDPGNVFYLELIVWLELQRKNFYGAFIQSKALDKRMGNPGTESIRIGEIAMENENYIDAQDIFDYVADEYGKQAPYYARARQLSILARERDILNTFPIDTAKIFLLTQEYQQLYNEFGPTPITLVALKNKARLLAFYLDKKDQAISSLNEIIETPRINSEIRDEAKLSLGDIYLLKDEPWEATLLYSQVEKTNKYAVIGYEAKLRNAKLNYYTGNFALAKSHLDVLKNATTKQIANDALDLSVLIKNNTVLDTSDFIMQEYAAIDLLLFQNKNTEAKNRLETLIAENPFHSITDEAYWLLSKISIKAGKYEEALNQLEYILKNYPQDILGDDAFFTKAKIYEEHLNDTLKASDLYREFLTTYPGSMYVSEARKKFRNLRGDQIN